MNFAFGAYPFNKNGSFTVYGSEKRKKGKKKHLLFWDVKVFSRGQKRGDFVYFEPLSSLSSPNNLLVMVLEFRG